MCAERRETPGERSRSPRRACAPWATTLSPGAMVRDEARWIALPDLSTCSSMTTQSAPAGTGAPVMISHADAGGKGPAGASPAWVDPAMGSALCVEASAARQA